RGLSGAALSGAPSLRPAITTISNSRITGGSLRRGVAADGDHSQLRGGDGGARSGGISQVELRSVTLEALTARLNRELVASTETFELRLGHSQTVLLEEPAPGRAIQFPFRLRGLVGPRPAIRV